MEIEIAKYPMRCHRCGKTEQVRVMVDDMHDEDVYRSIGILPTQRYAPDGWKWERDEDGQPRWVCPSCVAHDCGHCTHIRSSEQDGATYCPIAGREVCQTDQPCEFFSGLVGV